MTGYWNHNTAYHRWIKRIAVRRELRDVLDVGCGDGLLLQRLAPISRTVTGVEPHSATFKRAQWRLAATPNATLVLADFTEDWQRWARFDLIIFVASLHHMPLEETLEHSAARLRPGGDLLVIGLAANKSIRDWALSGLSVPLARLGSWLHRETRNNDVPVAHPKESLAEIRNTATQLLPGAHLRRGLYFRHLLQWTKPTTNAGASRPSALTRPALTAEPMRGLTVDSHQATPTPDRRDNPTLNWPRSEGERRRE